MKRGDEISRPNPWSFVAHGDPRAVSTRQHQLRGSLARFSYEGRTLDVWQYEVTGAGRLWYAIDDDKRTLRLIRAGTGHPKQTE